MHKDKRIMNWQPFMNNVYVKELVRNKKLVIVYSREELFLYVNVEYTLN